MTFDFCFFLGWLLLMVLLIAGFIIIYKQFSKLNLFIFIFLNIFFGVLILLLLALIPLISDNNFVIFIVSFFYFWGSFFFCLVYAKKFGKLRQVLLFVCLIFVFTPIFFIPQLLVSSVISPESRKTIKDYYSAQVHNYYNTMKNQNNKSKEIFDEKDIVNAGPISLQIINKGYLKNNNKFIHSSDFLRNETINHNKTFLAGYCYTEFKFTSLKDIWGQNVVTIRNIEPITVVSLDNIHKELKNITIWPSGFSRLNKTGTTDKSILAFDCENSKSDDFLIYFSSCDLRGGCADQNETGCCRYEGGIDCNDNKFCSYDEYTKDIKFKVKINKII